MSYANCRDNGLLTPTRSLSAKLELSMMKATIDHIRWDKKSWIIVYYLSKLLLQKILWLKVSTVASCKLILCRKRIHTWIKKLNIACKLYYKITRSCIRLFSNHFLVYLFDILHSSDFSLLEFNDENMI